MNRFDKPRRPGRAQISLFALGLLILALGGVGMSEAAQDGNITYNDQRVTEVVNGLLTYFEGSFGAIIMVFCGLFTICAAAFGQYRVAIGLMVVAIGSFTLRSFMSTFFNDVNITDGGGSGTTSTAAGSSAGSGTAGASIYAARHVKAVDVFVPARTPVLAYQTGEVTGVGTKGKCGNYVVLNHGEGITSVYCHLDSISVQQGQTVPKGARIASVGSSGLAANTRPHLHFEVRKDGKSEDARRYLENVQWDDNGRAKDLAPFKGQLIHEQESVSEEDPGAGAATDALEPAEDPAALPADYRDAPPEERQKNEKEGEPVPSDDYVSF